MVMYVCPFNKSLLNIDIFLSNRLFQTLAPQSPLFRILQKKTCCNSDIELTKLEAKDEICQSLYYPTNARNVKNVELLKHIKIMEAAPTCFGLQRNHHQGTIASAQLKLRDWFSVDIDVMQTLSVLQRHSMTCVVHCTSVYACTVHSTHVTQVILCGHSTDNVGTVSI